MGTSQKSAAVTTRRESLEEAPRTAATARVREVWDRRLRRSERERILELAGVGTDNVSDYAERKWQDLEVLRQRSILIVLRDLEQLGNEAAYALGYSRRNG